MSLLQKQAMTIQQARKLLGSSATGISDEEISRELRTAELLKDLFFQWVLEEESRATCKADRNQH